MARGVFGAGSTTNFRSGALGEQDLLGFVSDHENHAAQRRLNGGDSPAITHDKSVLYLYLRALGLRPPELLGIIHRVGDGWIRPDRMIPTRGDFEEALAGLPPEVVVKPTIGYGGPGFGSSSAATGCSSIRWAGV